MVPAASTGGHDDSRLLRGCAAPRRPRATGRPGAILASSPSWRFRCRPEGGSFRRAGLQCHAGGAHVAGRDREPTAPGRADLRQRACPEAGGPGVARKRGAPEPGGDVCRGGVLDGGGRVPGVSGPPRRSGNCSGSRRMSRSPPRASTRLRTPRTVSGCARWSDRPCSRGRNSWSSTASCLPTGACAGSPLEDADPRTRLQVRRPCWASPWTSPSANTAEEALHGQARYNRSLIEASLDPLCDHRARTARSPTSMQRRRLATGCS